MNIFTVTQADGFTPAHDSKYACWFFSFTTLAKAKFTVEEAEWDQYCAIWEADVNAGFTDEEDHPAPAFLEYSFDFSQWLTTDSADAFVTITKTVLI